MASPPPTAGFTPPPAPARTDLAPLSIAKLVKGPIEVDGRTLWYRQTPAREANVYGVESPAGTLEATTSIAGFTVPLRHVNRGLTITIGTETFDVRRKTRSLRRSKRVIQVRGEGVAWEIRARFLQGTYLDAVSGAVVGKAGWKPAVAHGLSDRELLLVTALIAISADTATSWPYRVLQSRY